jgi:murein DD-endopeptidase MepM/ murein hydrolase activator NlpD
VALEVVMKNVWRIRLRFLSVLLLCLVFVTPALAAPVAQTQTGEAYIVQQGDTLLSIAITYDVTVDELLAANQLTNPNLIFAGQKLLVPGLALAPAPIAEDDLPVTAPGAARVYEVQPGDTLFGIAARFGFSVEELTQVNGILDADMLLVGQVLILPGTEMPQSLPYPFASLSVSPQTLVQGQTALVEVALDAPAALSAEFDGRPVHFYDQGDRAWALIGMHALQPVGIYPVSLVAEYGEGEQTAVTVDLLVGAGSFVVENIQPLPGQESLLDPDAVAREYELVRQSWSQLTPAPWWEGSFLLPLATNRITSFFGTRRSYGGGNVDSFHSGVDFGDVEGAVVFAPAAGRVVLAEPLTVRGQAVIIDHGMGVFSGYWHLSGIAVDVGQVLQAGDLIGYVGSTGLSTGPHLHWEIRVDGIAVDPLEWTERIFP